MKYLVVSACLMAVFAGTCAAQQPQHQLPSEIIVDGRRIPIRQAPNAPDPATQEPWVRLQIKREVQQAFLMQDFRRLDELLTGYASRKERTGAGDWKLTIAYQGLAELFTKNAGRDEQYFLGLERNLAKWLSSVGRNPGAQVAQVIALYNRGWRARGTGFASTVTAEMQDEYQHYISAARAHLEASWDKMEGDPHRHALRLRLALEQRNEDDDIEKMLVEATTAHPEYYPIYYIVARHLQPKWGGSMQEFLEFADQVVKHTSETMGQSMFARITWQFYDELDGSRMLARKELDWERLKTSFEDLVQRHPDAFNKNRFANMACAAEDRETTHRLFTELKGEIIVDAWSHVGMISRCNALHGQVVLERRRQEAR